MLWIRISSPLRKIGTRPSAGRRTGSRPNRIASTGSEVYATALQRIVLANTGTGFQIFPSEPTASAEYQISLSLPAAVTQSPKRTFARPVA
ncbi:hypothetical protein D3C87_1708740 [compost metagenome]